MRILVQYKPEEMEAAEDFVGRIERVERVRRRNGRIDIIQKPLET